MLKGIKILFIYMVLLITTITFYSCSGVFKSLIKDNGTQIPSDLGKTSTTILVIKKNARSYDKYLEKNWKKYYKGEYIILTKEEVNQEKYQDKDKYRYVFDEGAGSGMTITNSSGGNTHLAGATFYLLDRKDNHKYVPAIESGLWSKLMIAYIKKMNEIMAKNGGK